MSTVINICSYTWRILTAAGLISDAVSSYWYARILFPISEGFLVLPAAMVVSVWVDVANSSMSRSKVTIGRILYARGTHWCNFARL